jgi:vitamin B12/bleomycin/antimicrobial peptide transport system ATP-binding/permease protein
MCLLRALKTSRQRYKLAAMAAALVVVVIGNSLGQIKLNAWHGSFFDALERRSFGALGDQLIGFLIIVGILLFLVVAQTWLQEIIKTRLREWLTHDLVDQWLTRGRPHRLADMGETGTNPDQYIQADARHLAEMSATLASGLLQSSLLLISFIGVLWVLSSQVVFSYNDQNFTIPGYMVWCALAYAIAGSCLTWFVGRPLIKLNAERYAREADLRFAIVHINESAEAIAMHGGESDERRIMNTPIASVVKLGCQLANGLARLTWVSSGYGWLAIIVPILVAAPGFFGGSLTLGGLMMVAGAFNQVQNSLRWFVDNFAAIADWRATLLRVTRFRNGLVGLDSNGPETTRIALTSHPHGKLRFENLSILLPDGRAAFDSSLAEIEPGERVLIAGAPGSGKCRLLRAVAGLSLRGSGEILLPEPKETMFVPPRPYLPLGLLRNVATYPAEGGHFDDSHVHAAFERVGLSRLIGRLDDKEERWDRVLSAGEQQRLALARLLLHAPRWVFFEDVLSSMSEDDCQLMKSIFARELKSSAVVGIGSGPALNGFYHRTIRLRRIAADQPDISGLPNSWPLPHLQAAE